MTTSTLLERVTGLRAHAEGERARRSASSSARIRTRLERPIEFMFARGFDDIEASRLDPGEQVDQLVLLERMKAHLEFRQLQVLAAMDDDDPSEEQCVVEEVRCALRLSAVVARSRLELAHMLARSLPQTAAALEQGVISLRHAQVMGEAARRLPDVRTHRELEDRLMLRAPDQTPSDLNRRANRAVLRIDPDGAARRHAQAREERRLERQSLEDGMAELRLRAPAAEVAAVWTRLDACARQFGADDPRTIDQRRADILIETLLAGRASSRASSSGASSNGASGGASSDASSSAEASDGASGGAGSGGASGGAGSSGAGSGGAGSGGAGSGGAGSNGASSGGATSPDPSPTRLPDQQGLAPRIEVVVSLSTLLGLDDQPGDLAGYGPITAQMARDLASRGDATWRRLVTDPLTGSLLDYGRSTYRPPADLRDFVLARDVVCAFPGCNMPGRLSQIDHLIAYDGDELGRLGRTSRANTAPLCCRHHNAKTRRDWSYCRQADGSYLWTSRRSGRSYVSWIPERWNQSDSTLPPDGRHEDGARSVPDPGASPLPSGNTAESRPAEWSDDQPF